MTACCTSSRSSATRALHVIPDGGLRTRSLKVTYRKLQSTVTGLELAKRSLGL